MTTTDPLPGASAVATLLIAAAVGATVVLLGAPVTLVAIATDATALVTGRELAVV